VAGRLEEERGDAAPLGRLHAREAAKDDAGHGSPNRAIPFGVPATLDAEAGTLVFDPCVDSSSRSGRKPR